MVEKCSKNDPKMVPNRLPNRFPNGSERSFADKSVGFASETAFGMVWGPILGGFWVDFATHFVPIYGRGGAKRREVVVFNVFAHLTFTVTLTIDLYTI